MEVIQHNNLFDIGIFARVCYNKELKTYTKSNLFNFVSNVLYRHKHMSVFEHIWYHIKFPSFVSFNKFSKELITELLNIPQLNRFLNLFYFDSEYRIVSFTARTLLDLLDEYNTKLPEILKQIYNTVFTKDHLLLALITSTHGVEYLKNRIPDIDITYINLTDDKYNLGQVNKIDLSEQFIYFDKNDKPYVSLISKSNNRSKYQTYTFYLHRIPIYVRDQIVRHRFGVFTIKSLRYTTGDDFVISKRAKNVKLYKDTCKICSMTYNELIEEYKEKKELARSILPFTTSTSFFWTLPKISLDNFIKLRTDRHAQYETRIIAEAIKNLI